MQRSNGIPDFIFVPVLRGTLSQSQEICADWHGSPPSIDSQASLEGSRFVTDNSDADPRQAPPKPPRRSDEYTYSLDSPLPPTGTLRGTNRRTQSLPALMFPTYHHSNKQILSPGNSSKTSSTDRAPRVPRRRRSIQTAASCPLLVVPAVCGALAA